MTLFSVRLILLDRRTNALASLNMKVARAVSRFVRIYNTDGVWQDFLYPVPALLNDHAYFTRRDG